MPIKRILTRNRMQSGQCLRVRGFHLQQQRAHRCPVVFFCCHLDLSADGRQARGTQAGARAFEGVRDCAQATPILRIGLRLQVGNPLRPLLGEQDQKSVENTSATADTVANCAAGSPLVQVNQLLYLFRRVLCCL